MYTHSSQPRATGLVTTTKRSITATAAFLEKLRERAGVTVTSKRSGKVPPKPIPSRHKTDPFNDKTVHPFRELNEYLNQEELMKEEDDEEERVLDRNHDEVTWAVSLQHDFREPSNDKNPELGWTDDELELKRQMGLHIRAGKTFGADFFYNFFQSLRLYKAGISEIDKGFLELRHLKELTLCGNNITALQNLPPSLQVLNVQYNKIQSIAGIHSLHSLQHLGLSYNQLGTLAELIEFCGDLKELRSLDLGYNSLCDHHQTIAVLNKMPLIKNLILVGNPLCLVPNFRLSIISSLPLLRWLDDITISNNERSAALELTAKQEAQKQRSVELSDAQEETLEKQATEAAEGEAAEGEGIVDVESTEPVGAGESNEPLDPNRVELCVTVSSVDGMNKLTEVSPEEEAELMPDGPWMNEPVEGEDPPPPKPVLRHCLYISGSLLGQEFRSELLEIQTCVSHLKLQMQLLIPQLLPTVRTRDLLHSCGVEFHIVRRTTITHSENSAYYAALPVPEDTTEEEAEKLRAIPEDSEVDQLLRAGSCALGALLQGQDVLQLQAEMWGGLAIEQAKLDNFTLVFDHQRHKHSEMLKPMPQSLQFQVSMSAPGPDVVVPQSQD